MLPFTLHAHARKSFWLEYRTRRAALERRIRAGNYRANLQTDSRDAVSIFLPINLNFLWKIYCWSIENNSFWPDILKDLKLPVLRAKPIYSRRSVSKTSSHRRTVKRSLAIVAEISVLKTGVNNPSPKLKSAAFVAHVREHWGKTNKYFLRYGVINLRRSMSSMMEGPKSAHPTFHTEKIHASLQKLTKWCFSYTDAYPRSNSTWKLCEKTHFYYIFKDDFVNVSLDKVAWKGVPKSAHTCISYVTCAISRTHQQISNFGKVRAYFSKIAMDHEWFFHLLYVWTNLLTILVWIFDLQT